MRWVYGLMPPPPHPPLISPPTPRPPPPLLCLHCCLSGVFVCLPLPLVSFLLPSGLPACRALQWEGQEGGLGVTLSELVLIYDEHAVLAAN